MSGIINIAIAEDFELERKGLVSLLGNFPGFNVVLEAANGKELLEKMPDVNPHILLLDINMKVMDGRSTFSRMKSRYPAVKIIMLTEHFDDAYILEFMSRGAAAFLSKNNRIEKLAETIRKVHEHGKAYDGIVANILARSGDRKLIVSDHPLVSLDLTRRQLDVLRLMCMGKENKEIATILELDPRTVETHRSFVWKRTGCENIVELIEFAFKNNIITF